MKENIKNILLLIAVFLVGFAIGGYYFQNSQFTSPEGVSFNPLFEVWGQIQNKFYGYSPKIQKEMLYGAMQGTVDSLKDPYSDFLNPKEASQFEEELSGSYEGIGAELTMRNDELTIISPLKNTPADRAGLMAGDKVLEINGKKTDKMTLLEGVMKIRGKAGTSVILKIKRSKKIFTVKIKRAKVEIPVLSFKKLNDDVAYIQIFNFYENTYPKFKEVAEKILNSKTNKIILDLRGNPGGFLDSAVDIGGFFISEDKTVLKQDFGNKKIDNIKSKGPGSFANFKIVILIDKGSASASEILAGAIKENNKKVKLIGEKTFGKGTVQEFINLHDKSALKITTAHWLLPSGTFIEKKGIKPDITVKMTEADINKGRDPQLDRAKKEIRK
jgi:carboxyl-terminal processing protease